MSDRRPAERAASLADGSLLDRVLDRGTSGRAMTMRDLHASIQQDLENLLNARRPWASLPEPMAALRATILGYGLPDFTAGAFNARVTREALCREVGATIRRFEPRLSQVNVTLRDRSDTTNPLLRLRIEAVIRLGDADEPVVFDTQMDATTSELRIRRDMNG